MCPVPTLLRMPLHRAAICQCCPAGSIRPNGRAPSASQPLRAPSSDSLHHQPSRTLLSTPCTLAVASQQASHHRRGRAITGRHRIVGVHATNSARAFAGQTDTSRVSMGSASSSLAIWFAPFYSRLARLLCTCCKFSSLTMRC